MSAAEDEIMHNLFYFMEFLIAGAVSLRRENKTESEFASMTRSWTKVDTDIECGLVLNSNQSTSCPNRAEPTI